MDPPPIKFTPFNTLYRPAIILTFTLLSYISYTQTCAANQYQYAPANLCIPCPLACATCTNSITCTTCESTATIIATLNSQKCYCQNGKYYNPKLIVCDSCNKVILNCRKCSVGLSSTVCLACNDGFYLHSATSCAACPPTCRKCLSASQCLTCYYNEYALSNGQCICDANCLKCSTIDPSCLDCSGSNCRECQIGYRDIGKTCAACQIGCQQCTGGGGSDCRQCLPGYFRDSNKDCQLCSVFFTDPQCTECESTQCTVCAPGFRLNMATLICIPDVIITCLPTQILIETICIDCLIIFDPLCSTCDQSGCIACQSGYMIDSATNACMKIPVCGDGDWAIGYQDCDDKNAVDGDGCSSMCKIQTDYECLVAEKLTTGESFCKYTKDFVLNLQYVLKEESSNVAYFYFNFQATTFQLWTEAELAKFLIPIQIIDSNTGTGNAIPYNTAGITFKIVNGVTQLLLTIDYGLNNIENSYIKFAMDPSQTVFPQINTKTPQLAVFHLIDSRTNGVNLYSYSSQIYDMQKTIYTLSEVLGYTSFVFLLLGLVSPVGKIIVVEALAVIQLGFFTVLQFDKIPPTFIGFKYLLPSSGINDIGLATQFQGQKQQIIYKTMGLDSKFFANYNVTLALFFLIPFLIGLIGSLILKFASTKSPRYYGAKETLLTDSEKKRLKQIDVNNHFTDNLRNAVFKRIVFQVSFYGIIIAGYLAWISAFNSFRYQSEENIIGFVLIPVIWITYAVLYLKIHTKELHLPEHYTATFDPQNTFILKGFGDFRDVYQQISKHNFYYIYAVEKIYLAFIIQRVFVSVLIVYVSDLFGYTSIIIASIYLAFFVVLITLHLKYQKKKNESERKSVFSYLNRNYVLRQSFNFITTILVQALYFIQSFQTQNARALVETLSKNYLTTELIPLLIILILYINFMINAMFWIWQLKSTQIIRKTLEMIKFFFSQKDNRPYIYNLQGKKKKKLPYLSTDSNEQNFNTKISLKEEDKMIEQKMKKYADKIISFQPIKSPFSGFVQSESKLKRTRMSYQQNDSSRKINIEIPKLTQNQNKILVPQDAL